MAVVLPDPEWIELEGAVNARAVVPGVLLRSDNLQALTDADIERLVSEHDLGVVIDLRTDAEAASEGPGPLVSEPAVEIRHHSLYPDADPSDTDATVVNPWQASHGGEFAQEPAAVQAYMSYLVRRPDSVVAAVRAIATSDSAVLVHCAAGKDRTGTVVAIALDAVGVDREQILDDYLITSERIEAILARLRQSPTYAPGLEGQEAQTLAPRPETMQRVFALIDERYGGSVAWLASHGFTADELDRLRARLLTDVR